jgi:dTDP-4-amino-4,6-dideoxygalactose transaminase
MSPKKISAQPFSRNHYSSEDIESIQIFLKEDNVLSYYGDEGLQHTYEDALKTYFNVQYAILVNSGTNALFSAYFSLGIMPNDEVIVPAFSFFAIASPLLLLHAKIVMADCSAETGLISTQDVLMKISDKTKAVVINHVAGDSIDMLSFVEAMHKRNIAVIEDLSLAFGATDNGRRLGTFGDLTCCSLGSTKMLSGGQGGFVVTNNREYFERIVLLGCFGKRAHQNVINPFYRQFINVSYGLNIRMHSLAIAVSFGRFNRVDELIQMRHERYMSLTHALSNYSNILSPPRQISSKTRGSWHGYYALLSEELSENIRNGLVQKLQEEKLCVSRGAHYPLLHKEKIYYISKDGFYRIKDNPFKDGVIFYDCPEAVRYNSRIVSFPLFLDEDMSIIEHYCDKLERVLSNY